MTQLVVRRLLVDMTEPFAHRWNGGDAFTSAFFNALSMSFPQGEQYFIDSVRAGLKELPDAQREKLAVEVQGFIGQEATHRRLHALYNDELTRQGFDNEIERRATRRTQKYAHRNVRIHLAATAATEHFTALLAHWLLSHPEVLADAEPRLRTLWQWHCAEESEHRCTAFDVYKALGGNEKVRVGVFNYITVMFLTDVTRQTVRNLWQDRSLFRLATWRSAARFLFARDGLLRENRRGWKAYKSADFHPSQQDDALSANWLRDNAATFTPVGRTATV